MKIEQEQQQTSQERLQKKSVGCQAFRSRESIHINNVLKEHGSDQDKEAIQDVISIQEGSSRASNHLNQVQMIFLCSQITL